MSRPLIAVVFTEEDLERVVNEATKNRLKKSTWIRNLVLDHLDKLEGENNVNE